MERNNSLVIGDLPGAPSGGDSDGSPSAGCRIPPYRTTRRLELRLLSRNSQLQLGQILSLATVSSRSSDSAETASAASKAIGVAGSPNGASGARRLRCGCRREPSAQARRNVGSRRWHRARSSTAGAAKQRGRSLRGSTAPIGAIAVRRSALPAACRQAPPRENRLPHRRSGRSRPDRRNDRRSLPDRQRSTTVFAVSSASMPPEKRCGVQDTVMRKI